MRQGAGLRDRVANKKQIPFGDANRKGKCNRKDEDKDKAFIRRLDGRCSRIVS
jgi:hypothetical protein